MWSSILIKSSLAGVAVVAVASGGLLYYDPSLFGIEEKIEIYGITESITNSPSDEISTDLKNKNYLCKLSNNNSYEDKNCYIEEIEYTEPETKKHLDLNEISKIKTTAINKDTLKTQYKILKITTNAKIGAWDNDSNVKLSISSTKSTETNKEYAKVIPLFALKYGKPVGKTSYLLVKANEFSQNSGTSTTLTTSNKTLKCGISTRFKKEYEECKILDFASSQTANAALTSVNYTKPSNENTNVSTVEKNKFYLIKYTNPQSIANLSKNKIIYTHVLDSSDAQSPTTSSVNRVGYDVFGPVVQLSAAASSKDYAIILK